MNVLLVALSTHVRFSLELHTVVRTVVVGRYNRVKTVTIIIFFNTCSINTTSNNQDNHMFLLNSEEIQALCRQSCFYTSDGPNHLDFFFLVLTDWRAEHGSSNKIIYCKGCHAADPPAG